MCMFMFHFEKFCCRISTRNHGSLFVPQCSPLAWINALLLSQCSEQAGGSLLDPHRHKSIERYSEGRGGGGGVVGATLDVCVCAPLVVGEGAKADTLHLDHLL